MKTGISILWNVTLLSVLTISLASHRQEKRPTVAMTTSPESIDSQPARHQEPFRWSQLEGTNDYATYVANLRAVGCPEPTIRAIVTADIETACNYERRQLEQEGETANVFSPETARQLVAKLLSKTPLTAPGESTGAQISATPANSQPQPADIRTARPVTVKASYPLAFQHAAQNDSTLTENQKAAVRQVQQQFVEAIGSANQNPNDPAYAARWQTARQDADDTLRAKLGNQAYNAYQLQHYYSNFQQVVLNAGDGPVTINPDALAR